ncbi:M57 family metalloprotease [Methanimicrococcus hongohii]
MDTSWRSASNLSIDTWNAAGGNISIAKQNSNTSNTVNISIGKYILPNENWAGQEKRTSGVTLPNGNIEKRGSEIKLNVKPTLNWSTSSTQNTSAIDVRSVVLHELGHSLGMGHSDNQSAVMQGTVTANKRTLTR